MSGIRVRRPTVEDADGLNEGTDLEWLRVDALKMLAAVTASEQRHHQPGQK